jgi:hypothetical protein
MNRASPGLEVNDTSIAGRETEETRKRKATVDKSNGKIARNLLTTSPEEQSALFNQAQRRTKR